MLTSIVFIVVGLLLLLAGGESLLRGAVGLATILRLTPAVIGLTVVAAGTSVPELAVSGIAAWQGKAEIAAANIIGSNIFNITVIIGLCALIRPILIIGNTIKLEYPVLVLVTLLFLVIGHDGEVDRLDAVCCLAIYVGFTAYLVSLVRRQLTPEQNADLKQEVQELSQNGTHPKFWRSVFLVVAGAGCLAGGAHVLVLGASDLARMLGWSERLIGLTIVSIGTGMPEVVASVVSSIRGRSDIAIGNVIGSNLFNILMILGISGSISPLAVQAELITIDGIWMMGVTLLLFPLMFTGLKVNRWEGVILMTVYGVYLAGLIRSAS